MLNTQRLRTGFGNRQQAIDIGVLARIGASIRRVFGKDFQPLLGGINGDRTPDLRQVVIDGERALATRCLPTIRCSRV